MNNRRATQQWWRTVWFVCAAMAVLATACGSDAPDEVRAAEEAASTAEPAPTAEPVPTIAPTSTPEPTASPQEDVTNLESVYDEPPANGGWPVPAGVWSSSSFSTPLRFDLPVDATLMSDGLGRIEFAVGPAEEPDGWLYIVEPVALNRPTGPIPIDLVDPKKAFDGATILGERSSAGPLGEFTLTDFRPDMAPVLEPFTRPCFRRPERRCIAPYVTGSGQNAVVLTMDGIHRVAGFEFGEEGRLNVIAVVNDENNLDFLDYADALAESLTTIEAPWTGTVSLDTLGIRGDILPAGRWVRGVGSTLVKIDLDQDMTVDPLFYPEMDVIGIEAGGGAMYIAHHDPRYDLETGNLPPGAGPWTPAPAADVQSHIEAVTESLTIAEITFAGFPAVEFSDAVFDTGEPCPRLVLPVPDGAQCAVLFRSTTSTFFGYEDPAADQRLIYIEDLGLLVTFDTPLDDEAPAAAFAAIKAALTLTPMN